ncbi:MAG TPA: FGGY family carbohydrate kinase [Acidimicrobiales bacterium]|nr:FGGY family carbohydrate kinase [Acidimicrobiales bacterium]
MGELFLGIDLGTTATKVTLFDPDRGAVASVSEESSHYSANPAWSEADTSVWWRNVCELVPRALDVAGARASEVRGVAASGMVPAVVLLDGAGKVLRRAILQNDARAVSEIAELAGELDREGFDVLGQTGSDLTQQSVAPTWQWLTHHEPEIATRAAVIVGSYDWLAIALGADNHVEANWALESGLYDLSGHTADAVLSAAGLPGSLCPPVVQPGQVVGRLSRAAGQATSLPEGLPIYAGGADHVLAAYAAGLSSPGDWLIKLGGAGDILVVTDAPAIDRRWYLDAHPAPGLWLPNGCMATSGSLLRWLQAIVGGVPLEELDREADAALPASLVCLPYFLGEKSPLHDPDLRGALIGLHLGSTRGDMFRACMEATAYGFREHVDAFKEEGLRLGDGRVSNGGSGSMAWKQILADVLGTELTSIADHGGASLGAALVAAVGSGSLPDWTAAAKYVSLGHTITPRQEHADRYTEAYAMYLELQRVLTPFSHRLAARGRR